MSLGCLFLVGLPASGKSCVLNVAEAMPLYCLEWSEIIKKELGRMGTSRSRQELLVSASEMVRERGVCHIPEIIVEKIRKDIGAAPEAYRGVVISGARNPLELEQVAKHFSRNLVVVICADWSVRFRRSLERARSQPGHWVGGGCLAHHPLCTGAPVRSVDRLAVSLSGGFTGARGVDL